jgi:hypothetical protein
MGGALRPEVASAPHEASGAARHPAQPLGAAVGYRLHKANHVHIQHANTAATYTQRGRAAGGRDRVSAAGGLGRCTVAGALVAGLAGCARARSQGLASARARGAKEWSPTRALQAPPPAAPPSCKANGRARLAGLRPSTPSAGGVQGHVDTNHVQQVEHIAKESMNGAQPPHCKHHLPLLHCSTRRMMQATTQSGCKLGCKRNMQKAAPIIHSTCSGAVDGGATASRTRRWRARLAPCPRRGRRKTG